MNNTNNAGDDDLTLPEANQNTVRPINAGNNSTLQATENTMRLIIEFGGTPCPVNSFRAQAQQIGSNPAVTVRAQVRHDVHYHDFMGLNECFVCQNRYPSERALCGHMKMHPDREWKGHLYPPYTPNAIRPPFFYVPEICPPPTAESSVPTVARGQKGTDAREREDSPCTPLKFVLNKVPDDENN